MNERLEEIIRYKTGGKKIPFAELMGWSPQYLSKMLRGENFGVQPILTVLENKLNNVLTGQSENSVAILLSGYSFVSLRHETMASITDSIS